MMEESNIRSILKNGNASQKMKTLIYLSDHPIKIPIIYLHQALKDRDKKVRATAAFALSKLGNRNSVKHLVDAWDSSGKKMYI